MVEKSSSNSIMSKSSKSSLSKSTAYPIIRKAQVICVARYQGVLDVYPGKLDAITPEREQNARKMLKFLKECHYEIENTNITQIPNPRFKFDIELDSFNDFVKEAELAEESKEYCAYFFYFTGYGVRINGQILGLDSQGNLIPFEYFRNRLAKCRKVLSYFYIECQFLDDLEIKPSALKAIEDYMHQSQSPLSSPNKSDGISLIHCPNLQPLPPHELLKSTDRFIKVAQSCIGNELDKFLQASDKEVITAKGKKTKYWKVWYLFPTKEQRDEEFNQKKEKEMK